MYREVEAGAPGQAIDRGGRPAARWVLPALIVIATGALTSATLAPVLVGLYVDQLRLSAAQASLAVGAENLAYAGGLLLFYLALHRLPRPQLAAFGLGVMIVASLLTAHAHGFWALIAIRTLFGVALGLASSTVFAAFAGRPDPQRVWALATFVNLAYAAALLSASGWISERFGLAGITAILAGVSVIGLTCIPALATGTPAKAAPPKAPPGAALTRSIPAACGVLALFCLYAGHTTLWSFQERMGVSVGLSRTQVGLLLGISILGAIVGSLTALFLGGRLGRIGPSTVSYIGLIASALLLASPDPKAYAAGAIIIKTAWFFGLPFILGAVARLDQTGRWSSLAAAMLALGSAVGPTAAAPIAQFGMAGIVFLAIGFYGLSFLFALPLLRADRLTSAAP
ncbi:MAG: hypothetical protein JWQ46_496 [Phenylobacterium sp.]|nr:hypothetical protein [Phenylobacterium sp.]